MGSRIDVLYCNGTVEREMGISFPAALVHEEGEFSGTFNFAFFPVF